MIKYALIALVALSAVPAEARPYQHPYFKWKKERLMNVGASQKQAQQNSKIGAIQKQAAEAARKLHCIHAANMGGRC
jgi:hypothetical protein